MYVVMPGVALVSLSGFLAISEMNSLCLSFATQKWQLTLCSLLFPVVNIWFRTLMYVTDTAWICFKNCSAIFYKVSAIILYLSVFLRDSIGWSPGISAIPTTSAHFIHIYLEFNNYVTYKRGFMLICFVFYSARGTYCVSITHGRDCPFDWKPQNASQGPFYAINSLL